MRREKKKISSLILAFVISALPPSAAFAAGGTPYMDENGFSHTTASPAATATASDSVWGADGRETWYAASGSVTIEGGIVLKGDVNLILTDGCDLVVKRKISAFGPGDVTFTVWAQSEGTGRLSAGSDGYSRGIFADVVAVNGGNVSAKGYESGIEGFAVMINGGDIIAKSYNGIGVYGETVVINGGALAAVGGYAGIEGDAIIFNGGKTDAKTYFGDAVNAGIVTVNGGELAASAPASADSAINGDVVVVNAGAVTAASVYEPAVYGGNVLICGGDVKAFSIRDYAVRSYAGVVSISGGLYEGSDADASAYVGHITGGVFKHNFAEGKNDPDLLAPDRTVRKVKLTNGVWKPSPDGDHWQVTPKEKPGKAADPVFRPDGGEFTDRQTVSISCATQGATIYYTTDGSEPGPANGVKYVEPFVLTGSARVKAVAVKKGAINSAVVSATFTKKTPPPVKTDIENPETGDGGGSALWPLLFVLSSGCAAFLSAAGKKRGRKPNN